MRKELFNKGIEELQEVFTGFEITKERAEIWYKYSKHLEDYMWEKKIASCIKGCRKIPTLADILDIKGYYREDLEPPHSREFYEEEEYVPGKMPPGFKEHMDKILGRIKMPKK